MNSSCVDSGSGPVRSTRLIPGSSPA
ncbi:hypothetical protein Tco_0694627, partial [Tanacetum coccineum]